ncbi:MAG: hypothetical protein V1742_03515 [Pseudomonadota bacterium]
MNRDLFPEEVRVKKEAEEQAEKERRRLLEDARAAFTTPAGRRVFWHLLLRCHFLTSVFTGNSRTYLMEGERAVGLYLINLVGEAAPGLLAEILTMGLKERENERIIEPTD